MELEIRSFSTINLIILTYATDTIFSFVDHKSSTYLCHVRTMNEAVVVVGILLRYFIEENTTTIK